jgi:hypothetical protein
MPQKTALGGRRTSCEHGAMRRESVLLKLNAWIDCPRCGRIDKLSRDFRLPKDIAGPMQLKVTFRCERCGTAAAFLCLDRTISSIH